MKKMNRILEVLTEKGKTQSWLSRQVDRTRSNISSICLNKSQPTMELLFDIAENLGVKPSRLIGDGSEITEDEK
jgi:putative transcriptional regulator